MSSSRSSDVIRRLAATLREKGTLDKLSFSSSGIGSASSAAPAGKVLPSGSSSTASASHPTGAKDTGKATIPTQLSHYLLFPRSNNLINMQVSSSDPNSAGFGPTFTVQLGNVSLLSKKDREQCRRAVEAMAKNIATRNSGEDKITDATMESAQEARLEDANQPNL